MNYKDRLLGAGDVMESLPTCMVPWILSLAPQKPGMLMDTSNLSAGSSATH